MTGLLRQLDTAHREYLIDVACDRHETESATTSLTARVSPSSCEPYKL